MPIRFEIFGQKFALCMGANITREQILQYKAEKAERIRREQEEKLKPKTTTTIVPEKTADSSTPTSEISPTASEEASRASTPTTPRNNPSHLLHSKMCLAIETKDYEDVLNYIEKTPSIDYSFRDDKGRSFLHIALMLGDDEILRKCIANTADPNMQDNLGYTPLHYAVMLTSPNMMNILLSEAKDIDVNVCSKKGHRAHGIVKTFLNVESSHFEFMRRGHLLAFYKAKLDSESVNRDEFLMPHFIGCKGSEYWHSLPELDVTANQSTVANNVSSHHDISDSTFRRLTLTQDNLRFFSSQLERLEEGAQLRFPSAPSESCQGADYFQVPSAPTTVSGRTKACNVRIKKKSSVTLSEFSFIGSVQSGSNYSESEVDLNSDAGDLLSLPLSRSTTRSRL